jgi:hypothetical protein
MSKKPVLHLRKGRTWLLNRGVKKRRSNTVFVPDEYRDETAVSAADADAGEIHYGIHLHAAPLEIADPLAHYFLPVEKAA